MLRSVLVPRALLERFLAQCVLHVGTILYKFATSWKHLGRFETRFATTVLILLATLSGNASAKASQTDHMPPPAFLHLCPSPSSSYFFSFFPLPSASCSKPLLPLPLLLLLTLLPLLLPSRKSMQSSTIPTAFQSAQPSQFLQPLLHNIHKSPQVFTIFYSHDNASSLPMLQSPWAQRPWQVSIAQERLNLNAQKRLNFYFQHGPKKV